MPRPLHAIGCATLVGYTRTVISSRSLKVVGWVISYLIIYANKRHCAMLRHGVLALPLLVIGYVNRQPPRWLGHVGANNTHTLSLAVITGRVIGHHAATPYVIGHHVGGHWSYCWVNNNNTYRRSLLGIGLAIMAYCYATLLVIMAVGCLRYLRHIRRLVSKGQYAAIGWYIGHWLITPHNTITYVIFIGWPAIILVTPLVIGHWSLAIITGHYRWLISVLGGYRFSAHQ